MHRFARWFRRPGTPLPGLLRAPARAAARSRFGLERTLHDGAVTEISALALELGMISATANDSGVSARVAAAQRRVTHILDDLRGVGSMIYPPVLASTGLGPGLSAVAERRGLDLRLDLPATELCAEARARAGLLVSDHFHTLPPGSVVRVRVRVWGRLVRVRVTAQRAGGDRHDHWAVLLCA